ncbi:Uncharacterised protein [Anaerobiospirillum thomasii]|uniref:hypothetical protein n=1 Tax=Anaerobiospirillum thomasii TaxID=179995 RepID=UPI000D8BCAA5|nr:hypothetical protein [Anaerobiospirillum thomasii]SPT68022.1 Uncharacterised protein [Anaerobiospirillum thomasii]
MERLKPECPPDAHKVIRPPENKLHALLAIYIKDDSEIKTYGLDDFCQVLSLMGQKPLIYCNDAIKEQICSKAAAFEIEPTFLVVHDDGMASIVDMNGATSHTYTFEHMATDYKLFEGFLDKLSDKCIISVDMLSMLILRSISTVFPWDRLLAGDFIRQYIKAYGDLNEDNIKTLLEIRYGRYEALDAKEKDPVAYQFLKLERKLFLQYPTDD